MVLWSTVARMPYRPGRASHVSWSRSTGAVAMGARVATAIPLSESLEVCGERLQVARWQRQGRNVAARLDGLRRDDPPHEIRLCVRQSAGRDRGARRDVREIGTHAAARTGAADRMAVRAAARHEHAETIGGGRIRRL